MSESAGPNRPDGYVLVTGVSKPGRDPNVGRQVASHLEGVGYPVVAVMHSRDVENAQSASSARSFDVLADASKAESGGTAHAYGDATSLEDMHQICAAAGNRWDQMAAWINCVGKNAPPQDIGEMGMEEWQAVTRVNLDSAFVAGRIFSSIAKRQTSGVLVNVASRLGKEGQAGLGPYCAAKFGVVGLTEVLAHELAPFKARVLGIALGTIDNRMTRAVLGGADLDIEAVEERISSIESSIPLSRLATGMDVALLVEFLISGSAAYMTGDTINLTGGRRMN